MTGKKRGWLSSVMEWIMCPQIHILKLTPGVTVLEIGPLKT